MAKKEVQGYEKTKQIKKNNKPEKKKSCNEKYLSLPGIVVHTFTPSAKPGTELSSEDPLEDPLEEKWMFCRRQNIAHALALTELCRCRKGDHVGDRALQKLNVCETSSKDPETKKSCSFPGAQPCVAISKVSPSNHQRKRSLESQEKG